MALYSATFFLLFLVFSTSFSKFVQADLSIISAAPAFLPTDAPLASAPSFSPDVSPQFPTTGGAAAPSPADSSMPTIPSNPSPPNPDSILAPGPNMAFSPSEPFFPLSGSVLPVSGSVTLLPIPLFLGLILFYWIPISCL